MTRGLLASARTRAAVLLLAATAALTATPAAPAYAGTASFSGTVTDSATGEPLAEACVLLWKDEGDTAYEQYPEMCTDETGQWSRTDLEPGTYGVQATRWGYVTEFAYDASHFWDSQRFTVADGESVTVDLAMEQAGSIGGTVTDAATGLPIWNACVSVDDNAGHWGSACTGEDGTYQIDGLLPGSGWIVQFADYDGRYVYEYAHDTTDYDAAERFTVVAGETVQVDESLVKTASITGTVTDAETGAPLAGICVQATTEPEGWDSHGFSCSDEEGRYLLTGVPEGTYHVAGEDTTGDHPRTWHPATTDPAASVPVVVASGGESVADIALPKAGFVSGTVRLASTGEPLEGVCVYAQRPSDGQYLRSAGQEQCTDAAGRYTVRGVPQGEVKIHFNPMGNGLLPQWAYGQETEATAALIPVVTGQTTDGVDAAILEGGKIAGRVVDAKTKQPIEGVCATVGVYTHRADENGTQWPPACTGSDGRYELRGLPSGSYTVQFYDKEGAWAWQFFPNKADRIQAAKVAVTAGTTLSGINAKMARGGTVEGVVLDSVTGEPADGVCVDGFSGRVEDPLGTTACTGPDGRYVLRGLPTTKIKVKFMDGGGDYATEWAFDKPSFATANLVATTAGATTTLANATVARFGPP